MGQRTFYRQIALPKTLDEAANGPAEEREGSEFGDDTAAAAAEEQSTKKKRGRPKGSKGKEKQAADSSSSADAMIEQ